MQSRVLSPDSDIAGVPGPFWTLCSACPLGAPAAESSSNGGGSGSGGGSGTEKEAAKVALPLECTSGADKTTANWPTYHPMN
eukprot:SAG22_NODE_18038_length_294_cov_0.851282_1_plen_81_part_01